MKILQIHNRYRSSPGGEDVVVENEKKMLENKGVKVFQYIKSNSDIKFENKINLISAGVNSIWSSKSKQELKPIIDRIKPDIAHVHNTFAVISPSIFYVLKKSGIPIVLTFHNYRLMCANSILLRDGSPCQKCVGHIPIYAFLHRCTYSNSLAIGSAIALNQFIHVNILKTYTRYVDRFITFSEFSRSIFIQAGIKPEKISIKPNFVYPSNTTYLDYYRRGKNIVFVGQIDYPKGIDLLIDSWKKCKNDGWKLLLAGDGPMLNQLIDNTRDDPSIIWLGKLKYEDVLQLISRCRYLILPSRIYEGFPLVILEAFSTATPIIVPDLGVFPSVATRDKNAIYFEASNINSLAEALNYAFAIDENDWAERSKAAYYEFTSRYSPMINYDLLMSIYDLVISD